MQWVVFRSSAGQIVIIRLHNFVQINISIDMHYSDNLGFIFKNHGWQFGVVTPQGSQMKTASILHSVKIQAQKYSHIFMPFERA